MPSFVAARLYAATPFKDLRKIHGPSQTDKKVIEYWQPQFLEDDEVRTCYHPISQNGS